MTGPPVDRKELISWMRNECQEIGVALGGVDVL